MNGKPPFDRETPPPPERSAEIPGFRPPEAPPNSEERQLPSQLQQLIRKSQEQTQGG